jgi:mannose-6-phosphate isomerase-like protein (cupin superfamily)
VTSTELVRRDGGLTFEDGDDRGRIIVSAQMTGGEYSVLEYLVAPRADAEEHVIDFGIHRHGSFEETFLVRSGELEFFLENQVVTVARGDFVRVPRGIRHGYRNVTQEPVDLVVTFVPGGFEELFLKYRTDAPQVDGLGFVSEATSRFDSEFE